MTADTTERTLKKTYTTTDGYMAIWEQIAEREERRAAKAIREAVAVKNVVDHLRRQMAMYQARKPRKPKTKLTATPSKWPSPKS